MRPSSGIHRAAYSAAGGRRIRQYTPAATYLLHRSLIAATRVCEPGSFDITHRSSPVLLLL
jgi:hypothetical protein